MSFSIDSRQHFLQIVENVVFISANLPTIFMVGRWGRQGLPTIFAKLPNCSGHFGKSAEQNKTQQHPCMKKKVTGGEITDNKVRGGKVGTAPVSRTLVSTCRQSYWSGTNGQF